MMPTKPWLLTAVLLVIPAGALALICRGDATPSAAGAGVARKSEPANSPPQKNAPPKKSTIRPAEKPPAAVVPLEEFAAAEAKAARRDTEIRKKMQTRITRKFDDVKLTDFLEALAKDGRFDVHLDKQALADEGIMTDTLVSVDLTNRTIEHALWRVLPALALTWVIRNEGLTVTTVTKAEEILFTRVYSLAGLASSDPRHEFFFGESPKPGIGPAVGDKPGPFDPLVNLIRDETSGPWFEIEGVGGTLSVAKDVLVVRQKQDVHSQIENILAGLRLAQAGKLKRGAFFIERSHYPYDEDAKIRRALGKNVTLNYTNKALDELLRDLQKKTGIEFVIQTQSLMDEGIMTDTTVEMLKLSGVTLFSALEQLLEPLALTFIPTEGVIVVTTLTNAEELLVTAIYDVGDLFQQGVKKSALRDLILNETSGPWFDTEGLGGNVSLWENLLVVRQTRKVQGEIANLLLTFRKKMRAVRKAGSQKKSATKAEARFYTVDTAARAKQLADVIPQFVDPAAWKNENVHPLIRAVENTLVVRQTPAMHRRISEFLRHLDGTAEPATRGAVDGIPRGFSGFGGGQF